MSTCCMIFKFLGKPPQICSSLLLLFSLLQIYVFSKTKICKVGFGIFWVFYSQAIII